MQWRRLPPWIEKDSSPQMGRPRFLLATDLMLCWIFLPAARTVARNADFLPLTGGTGATEKASSIPRTFAPWTTTSSFASRTASHSLSFASWVVLRQMNHPRY